jgi:hypothetical protein
VTAAAIGDERRVDFALAPSYLLLRVSTSAAARVRLYTDAASADADRLRGVAVEPPADANLVLEYVTTAGDLIGTLAPAVAGANPDPTSSTVAAVVANNTAAPTDIAVELTYIALEPS